MARGEINIHERLATSRRRLGQTTVLAILTHLAILPLLTDLVPVPDQQPARRVRLVSLTNGSHALAPKKTRAPDEAVKRELAEKSPDEDKPEDKDLVGQVVDVPPSASDEAPEKADYLSEHNTRTERETRSRYQSPDYLNSMNEASVALLQPARPQPGEQAHTEALLLGPDAQPQEQPSQLGTDATLELPSVEQRDRLALVLDPKLGHLRNRTYSDGLEGTGKQLRLSLGQPSPPNQTAPSAPSQGVPMAALVPEVGVLARISGGPTNDHLDLEEGDGTFLNSREFKFASFFNRMKRGVSQHWQPLVEYRRRDPTGNVYGQRARVTVLSVTLTHEGSVKNLEIQKSSGVEFLDREAVLAFRRAEPFPNPPKGLIDESGTITFPFGFHIEFSSGGGVRLPF